MRTTYCTYFNSGYLDRGIVMLRSLRRFDAESRLEILCFDDETHGFLERQRFANVELTRIGDFEARHPELTAVKPTRSRGEYFFTTTSSWTLEVARKNVGKTEFVTYLDADMEFLSSPNQVYDAMGNERDIMICDHHYERDAGKCNVYGRFNVGWLSFRLNDIGMECLERWARQCIEWCYDRVEDGKFADQKYLDEWPERYGKRLLVAPKALNLGPCGIGKGQFSMRDGIALIDNEPIILFHYQSFKRYGEKHYYIGYYYDYPITALLRAIYEPYVRKLQAVNREFGLAQKFGNARVTSGGLLRQLFTGYWLGHPMLSEVIRRLQRIVLVVARH